MCRLTIKWTFLVYIGWLGISGSAINNPGGFSGIDARMGVGIIGLHPYFTEIFDVIYLCSIVVSRTKVSRTIINILATNGIGLKGIFNWIFYPFVKCTNQ